VEPALEQTVENAKRMNNKEKRARFRELTRQARIQTGAAFAEAFAQPCFDFEPETERANRRAAFTRIRRDLEARR
jgi:hypothetical protein